MTSITFHRCPFFPIFPHSPILSSALQSNQGAQQDPPLMRHQTQVNRSIFQLPSALIQPSIWPSCTSFICDTFFLSSSNHPSIYPSLPLFHQNVTSGQKDLCQFVFIKEGKEQRSKTFGKTECSQYLENGQRVMCVSGFLQGCPSQQLASLNTVIEMTNRGACLGGFFSNSSPVFDLWLPIRPPLGSYIESGSGFTPAVIPC